MPGSEYVLFKSVAFLLGALFLAVPPIACRSSSPFVDFDYLDSGCLEDSLSWSKSPGLDTVFSGVAAYPRGLWNPSQNDLTALAQQWVYGAAASNGSRAAIPDWEGEARKNKHVPHGDWSANLAAKLAATDGAACKPPPVPTIVAPSNGATGQWGIVQLDWSDIAGASDYKVYFGTSASPEEYGLATSSTLEVSGLAPFTTYNWKIEVSAACDSTVRTTTPVWSFTTDSCVAPPAPVLVEPPPDALGTGRNVQLSWEASEGATDYQIFIEEFNPPTNLVETTVSTDFSAGDLKPNKVYYWRVAARSYCGADVLSSESEIRGLVTASAPSADAGLDRRVQTAQATLLGGSPAASGGTPPYTYEWALLSAGGASLDISDPANPSFEATDDGEYLCQLVVTDSTNLASPADQVMITACEPTLNLTSGAVTSEETRRGCLSITAGGSYGVAENGMLTLESPLVALQHGFFVDGELTVRHPAVKLTIVSTDPARAHQVAAGARTTFVLSVKNNTDAAASVEVAVSSLPADPPWASELFYADDLFQAVGNGSKSLAISLGAGEQTTLVADLAPPAGLDNGEEGGALVTVSRASFAEASVSLHARIRNKPKVYFVALDGLGPGYLEMDREGRSYDGTGERLMPISKGFADSAAHFPNAGAFLPASTDVDHTAAVGGSWPGTLGIPSIRRYYSGTKPNGNAEFLFVAKELLRWGPDGSPIRTIFDVIKDPAAGGSEELFSAFFSGKEWVGDLYRDDIGTVDIIAGGREHPDYTPAPSPFRLGDPISDPDAETDEEGTVLRRGFPLKALNVGNNPQAFPEDRWIAEAAIRTIAAEDPDVLYAILAECDTAQHIFGAADSPAEWTEEGTPSVLWDDVNVFNEHANRDPILDIVHEADLSFGLMLDSLQARGVEEHSVVILLSDHKLITAMNDPLPIGQILLDNGVLEEEVEFMLSRHSNTFLYLSDPEDSQRIEAMLEAYELLHPVLNELVKPFIVVNQDEMDSGIDNIEGHFMADGIIGNKRGELYSEWTIDFPVDDTSKVKWPHLILFNRHRFQNVLKATQEISGGIRGPQTIGTHSTPETASIPLAIRGPGIIPGVYGEKATLADIAPTLYQLLGLAPPEHVDGRVLDQILVP